jgi:hypothetical protein
MADDQTFIFDDDKAYVMEEGKVVASSNDVGELEDLSDFKEHEEKKKAATHIVTPNGLKGQILGRTPDLWGEEVTIRLENGRVAHLHVSDDIQFVTEEEAELVNPIVTLEKRLDEDYSSDRESLEDRQEVLDGIKQEARSLINKGASLADSSRLDDLVVTADAELQEIGDVVRQLDNEEVEAFAPPAPFDPQVVEQESLGGSDRGEWLDDTLNDMIQEAEGTDYERLMAEGPEVFVSELENPALADASAVREIASGYIRSKTAAADEAIREKYEKVWLARIEECRREELNQRKETYKKEAAQAKDEHESLPDDMLFY